MPRVLIVCLILLMAFSACGKKERGGEEAMSPKPNMPHGDLADGANPPEIMPGDKVYLELTIFHPRYIHLTGSPAVSVLTPGIPGLKFEKTQYDLTTAGFPMLIPFEILRDAPHKPYILRFGLRISYAFKADEIPLVRHEMLDVPVVITKRLLRQPRVVHLPLEHHMQIEQEERH